MMTLSFGSGKVPDSSTKRTMFLIFFAIFLNSTPKLLSSQSWFARIVYNMGMLFPDLLARPTYDNFDDRCSYLVTRETIILGSEDVEIPPEGIPSEGLCYVRRFGQTLRQCNFPFSKEDCRRRKNNDFCEEPWAR